MKPEITYYSENEDDGEYYTCPDCGAQLNFMEHKCKNCGTEIDWDGIEII